MSRHRCRTRQCSLAAIAFMVAIFAATPLTAEYLLETARQFRFATDEIATLDVEDLNGDGIPDLAGYCDACEFSGEDWLVVRLGLGDGTFGDRVVSDVSGTGGYTWKRYFAHLDGDEHLDLVILRIDYPQDSSSFNVFIGNGDGSFALDTGYVAGATYAIEVADFTGDGRADVALGQGASIRLYSGQGDGTFTPGPVSGVNHEMRCLCAGDFDEDGDVDLAAGNDSTTGEYSVSILINSGGGSFSPQQEVPGLLFRIDAADMNGDGHLDLLGADFLLQSVHAMSAGNGDGTFGTFELILLDPSPEYSAVGDVDGDGDLDIVGGTGYPGMGEVTTYLNDGSGSFDTLASCLGWGEQHALGDLDGDGILDLVMLFPSYYVENEYAATLLGWGNGTFHASEPDFLEGWEVTRLIVDDLNGDGRPDLAACDASAPTANGALWIGLNDDPNGFLEATVQLPGVNTWNLCAGDLNGDGAVDIFVVDREADGAHVLISNGDGTFQAPVTYGTGYNPEAAALGDLDGDGDVDAAVVHQTAAQLGVMLNNGDGTLGAIAYYDATRDATAVILADLDADGDLDAALDELESGGGSVVVVKNNGDGSFVPPQSYDAIDPRGIVADDFDGDEDIDLATGSDDGERISVLLNDGNGAFDDAVVYPLEQASGATVMVRDMTLDGVPDLVHLCLGSNSMAIVPGVGDGSFDTPQYFTTGWEASVLGLGDFDTDGDVDTVTCRWTNALYVTTSNAGDFEPTGLVVAGPGAGELNPALVRLFGVTAGRSYTEWHAYGVDRWGVNVALGELDGTAGPEVLTGAGPGAVFGPHVRGFQDDGTPLPGVSFLAYGTNKFGVNVSSGDLDGDGFDEIVTGAGPGAVFGPHVRGWNWDGAGAPQPIPGISYFAYGTPKWGVNVSCGDIDGDGYDEIVTGAGPGAVYGPHVRGWNCDGGGATAISAVSFLAYGTNKFGVNVSCGDIDGDGIDEMVTGAGPGAVFGPHVRAWNWDGTGAAQSVPAVSFFAYEYTQWGANVSCGDLDGDGIDEIITGPGPGETHIPRVRGWNYDGMVLTALGGVDFNAYSTTEVTHGVKVGGLRY